MTNTVTLERRLEDLLNTASDMQQRDFEGNPGKQRVRGGDYASFAIMAAGIELLGCLCNKCNISKSRISKYRFTKAIRSFFPEQYHAHAEQLYKLRCGLLHVCRPDRGVVLRSRAAGDREEHLSTIRGNLYLVAEELLSDSRKALEKIIEERAYAKRLNSTVMHTGT